MRPANRTISSPWPAFAPAMETLSESRHAIASAHSFVGLAKLRGGVQITPRNSAGRAMFFAATAFEVTQDSTLLGRQAVCGGLAARDTNVQFACFEPRED